MAKKNVYIIAGPNGAGKTTFANQFLPDYVKCPNFINADLVAKGLAPFNPSSIALKAGKIVLKEIDEYAKRGVDFSLFRVPATILADSGILAGLRIKDRVADGGHHIPSEDVRRRFSRGTENLFKLYMPLFDTWMLFNNSDMKPELIAKYKDDNLDIVNKDLFCRIKKGVRS